MSTAEEKPIFRPISPEIQSQTHGLLRLRNWTVKVDVEISRLCNASLSPRQFAQGLLARLSIDPPLGEADVEQWTDRELLEVGIKWWNFIEQLQAAQITVDSFEGLESAVRQRNAEHREGFNATMEKMAEKLPPYDPTIPNAAQ